MLSAKCKFLVFLLSSLFQFIACKNLQANREIIIEKILGYHLTSPGNCSDYFRYVRTNDFITGKLTLPNLQLGDNVTLQFYQSPFPENPRFQGILLPDEESSDAVLKKLQNHEPISYRADFPVLLRPPEMENIFINGRAICEDIYSEFGEKLILTHILKLVNNSVAIFKHNIHIPIFNEDPFCGIAEVEIRSKGNASLEHAGDGGAGGGGSTEIRRGEFPWLTAIYKKKSSGLDYICGGSLVSSNFILTTAHCVLGSPAGKIVASLGRYNLTNLEENIVETREIESLIFHPDYELGYELSDADVALLKMKERVVYTRFIKAICLWSDPTDESQILNQAGVVVGWIINAKGKLKSPVPKKLSVDVVPQAECQRSTLPPDTNSTSRFLCAGPCQNDVGDTLMFNRNGVWMLRAVVSSSLQPQSCKWQKDLVYSDLAKHVSWLKRYIEPQQQILKGSNKAICGKSSIDGRYPWLAAVYLRTTTGFLFHCTGALISSRSVLVPAHRFDLPFSLSFPGKLFQVFVGRHDLNNINEGTVWSRSVATLLQHPEFRWNNSFYGYDVALLQLDNPVRFTQHVKPICLWSDLGDQPGGKPATLLSWSWQGVFDETLTVPEAMKVNTVSLDHCQGAGLNVNSSAHFMCTPRFGNNVDGVLMMKRYGRWLLRGLSAVEYEKYWDRNNSDPYRVYSDITEYLPWIKENMLL